MRQHHRGNGRGPRGGTYLPVDIFLSGLYQALQTAVDLLAYRRGHPRGHGEPQGGKRIRQPLCRRRQPCEGRLAGGHEREPRPGDSLRIGEQLHRPCADSHARHDMRTLQGKPELRLHSKLAAAYRAEKRRRAPAVLQPGGLQGQEWGGGRVQAHYFRLCGDHK